MNFSNKPAMLTGRGATVKRCQDTL